jgi:DNA polymerase-1
MKKEPKTLYLVDGPALLYRNFYGLAPLRTTAGVPTQATYGFLRSLKKTIKECEVRLLAVCWDDKESLRKEEFAGYKAKRHAAPDELILQKQHIKEALEKMGVLQLCYKGLEADDVLGELALRYGLEESAQNVVIISPDKDLLQLVTQKVSVFDPMKNRLLRPEQVEERFGFGPEKVRFFFSLLGDASDGIPGVIGIGAKTATELAVQFDSLDDLYTKLDEVKKDRVRRLLTEGKEKAYLSSNLFALKKVNVQGDINQFIFSIDWWDRAYPLFEKLELKSFLHSSKPKPSQLSMFQGEVVAQPKNNNL